MLFVCDFPHLVASLCCLFEVYKYFITLSIFKMYVYKFLIFYHRIFGGFTGTGNDLNFSNFYHSIKIAIIYSCSAYMHLYVVHIDI